jgi:hypothetical protein
LQDAILLFVQLVVKLRLYELAQLIKLLLFPLGTRGRLGFLAGARALGASCLRCLQQEENEFTLTKSA